MQGQGALKFRLEASRRIAIQPLKIVDTAGARIHPEPFELACLGRARRHRELAAAAVADAVHLAVPVQKIAPEHAKACFQRAWSIVNAGVNDFAVARADMQAGVALALDDDDLAAAARDGARHGKSDDSGADDDAVDRIQPASASMACSSTLAPAARSAAAALSASLWLKPPAQGTNTMAVGATADTLHESWPAPLTMSMAG